MWLVALLLILVGNCILFTLLFSNTREPLSYSQQGYLYSVALLRASSCPDVLPPSGERKIVHLRGRVSSGPSWQQLKYRRDAGPQDGTGNKLSGFQRFGCVWLRLTRKFIEQGDVLRSGQGEQLGWSSLPGTWCHHGMGSLQLPRLCPAGPWGPRRTWERHELFDLSIFNFLVFFIYWSIDFTGDFLLRDINKQDLSLRDGGFFPGVGEI